MQFSGLEEAPCSGPECFSPPHKPADKRAPPNGLGPDADMQSRYDRLRAATGFLVLQVGVCPFTWDDETSSFVAHPYNFYVFPKDFRGMDRRFLCQTRCMSFLVEQKFDFNKLFSAGIPYLNVDQEAAARATMPGNEVVLGKIREEVVDFLADTSKSSVVLPAMNPFHRKLTYEDLTTTFRNAVTTDRATINGEMCIQVNRSERWHEMGRDKESIWGTVASRVRETAEREMYEAVGFRHVIDILEECKKPLVGHNMLLDLVMLYAHFIEDTPQELAEFKKLLHKKFPIVIDTKYLISSAPALV